MFFLTHLSNIDFSDGFVGTGRLTRSHCWGLNTQQTSKLPTSEDIYSDHRMWKGQRGRPGGLKGLRERGMERESKEGRKRPIGREMQNREYPTAASKGRQQEDVKWSKGEIENLMLMKNKEKAGVREKK